MRKVKDLNGFPQEKELDRKGNADIQVGKEIAYNQAREIIGELEIPERKLDMNKIRKIIHNFPTVMENLLPTEVVMLAQAICEGDVYET